LRDGAVRGRGSGAAVLTAISVGQLKLREQLRALGLPSFCGLRQNWMALSFFNPGLQLEHSPELLAVTDGTVHQK
jgi:hypothetical protein